MMAFWIGVPRTSLALSESGRQQMPVGKWRQELWLEMALQGRVLEAHLMTTPAQPPLPPPAPLPEPLRRRLKVCRYRITMLHYELENLQRQAGPLQRRYEVLSALRAYTGPLDNPERDARWLVDFEKEAEGTLLVKCDAGPPRLLEARIAGLTLEADMLEELLTQTGAG